jgi:hypothetical protein
MPTAPQLNRRKNEIGLPTGVDLKMLKAIVGGVKGTTLLVEKLRILLPNVSRSIKRLRRAGWIRKAGKDYAPTPKAKKLSLIWESPTACGSAPVKEEQATEQTELLHGQDGQNGFQLQGTELVGKLATGRTSGRRQRQRDLVYQREDWHLFLDPATLPQKAGCYPGDIYKIVLKELGDNALDLGAGVELIRNGDGSWLVVDNGPGLSPSEIVKLIVR